MGLEGTAAISKLPNKAAPRRAAEDADKVVRRVHGDSGRTVASRSPMSYTWFRPSFTCGSAPILLSLRRSTTTTACTPSRSVWAGFDRTHDVIVLACASRRNLTYASFAFNPGVVPSRAANFSHRWEPTPSTDHRSVGHPSREGIKNRANSYTSLGKKPPYTGASSIRHDFCPAGRLNNFAAFSRMISCRCSSVTWTA